MRKSILKDKHGAEMTIGTLVVIILAIIVLVFLVYGFSVGWGNLWGKLSSWGGQENIDDIVRGCEQACMTQSTYDYCSSFKDVKWKVGDEVVTASLTCYHIQEDPDRAAVLKDNNQRSEKLPGIRINCNMKCDGAPTAPTIQITTCDSLGGAWKASCGKDETDKTAAVTDTADKDANSGKVCCVSTP